MYSLTYVYCNPICMRLLIVILLYPFAVICIEMFFNIILEKISRVVFTSQKAEITRLQTRNDTYIMT